MQVVNSSQWDPTECITLKVRDKLITELIYDEIVRKRREQIKSVKESLQVVNFLKFVENWPELCKPCFVDGWQEISPEKLIDLFEPITADGKAHEQTQKWFIQYLKLASEEALSCLLRFVSAFSAIPAWVWRRRRYQSNFFQMMMRKSTQSL